MSIPAPNKDLQSWIAASQRAIDEDVSKLTKRLHLAQSELATVNAELAKADMLTTHLRQIREYLASVDSSSGGNTPPSSSPATARDMPSTGPKH